MRGGASRLSSAVALVCTGVYIMVVERTDLTPRLVLMHAPYHTIGHRHARYGVHEYLFSFSCCDRSCRRHLPWTPLQRTPSTSHTTMLQPLKSLSFPPYPDILGTYQHPIRWLWSYRQRLVPYPEHSFLSLLNRALRRLGFECLVVGKG
jgi:hypothetical protein